MDMAALEELVPGATALLEFWLDHPTIGILRSNGACGVQG